MPKPFDATLKDLVARRPEDFVRAFRLPEDAPAHVLNVDLSTVTAATDVVLAFGEPPRSLVDLNFQSSWAEDLASRVLLYNALLHHRFRVPVHSLVILLRPAAEGPGLAGKVRYDAGSVRGKMDFKFEVLRLWRRPVQELLESGLGALPLAALAQLPSGAPLKDALAEVIDQIDQRLQRQATPAEAAKLLTATLVLTGLRLSREETLELFQGVRSMRESTTYQMIVEEGKVEASREILVRQGRTRLGAPSRSTKKALDAVTDYERLRRMCDKVLVASSWQEILDIP